MSKSTFKPTLFFLFSVVLCSLWFTGCASQPVGDPNSAEGMFNVASELEKDDRYDEAIAKFNELKNKHPYSKYALDAELKIADIQYKKEAYIEAQTAYQLFKDFHPKNPKSDYVTFQLAMSYFNQLPSTIDRDLSPAYKAIQFFNEVAHSYSSSPYVKESLEKKEECLKMLAQKEIYIGNFYFKREHYDSAQKRYELLLSKYPDKGYDDEALYKAGVCAYESGDPAAGKKFLTELVEKHGDSNYANPGRKALERYGNR